MEQKVVLVTGGSRGIGAETAKLFAEKGYTVCINYKENTEAALALKEHLESQWTRCFLFQADVSDEQQVIQMFKDIDTDVGRLDVLVNNAGILDTQSPMMDMSVSRLNRIMATNVTSTFACSIEAAKRMSTARGGKGGVIINVSSKASVTGSPNEYVDYAASKAAVDTMTKGFAIEVATQGIRVNAVRPGLIHTEIHASGGEADRVSRLSNKIPMLRGGEALEVAKAIYWLASDDASFTTGSCLDVTGGL